MALVDDKARQKYLYEKICGSNSSQYKEERSRKIVDAHKFFELNQKDESRLTVICSYSITVSLVNW